MTMIDWSDPEEMFGLLCDYVSDERRATPRDASRRRFLQRLEADLRALADQIEQLPISHLVGRLRAVRDSHAPEFESDPVLTHVDDCIDELERIRRDHAE